ncbi:MAG: carboxy-S-adenosyl-L-methionine synthase CmoA [Acidobacteriia bacterium]|nr:carboxy-S-adenosyl-L-methionine synthase CmoA [Terriglobia bacterium]
MTRDQVFASAATRASDFEFNTEVARVFDDMVGRSVPFYPEQQRMVLELGKAFWLPGTNIYDLGCSTATTLIAMGREIPDARLIGYDNAAPMIAQANEKIISEGLADRIELRLADLNGALDRLSLDNASIVTLCWSLQFIRPLRRDNLIRLIYESLKEDGVLIITEKVLTNSSPVNRFFIDFYYEYKRRNGYSDLEITRKREALENVLVPYRIDENLEMFRRNGFEIVETFFQWYNFVGFLCVKKPAAGG